MKKINRVWATKSGNYMGTSDDVWRTSFKSFCRLEPNNDRVRSYSLDLMIAYQNQKLKHLYNESLKCLGYYIDCHEES